TWGRYQSYLSRPPPDSAVCSFYEPTACQGRQPSEVTDSGAARPPRHGTDAGAKKTRRYSTPATTASSPRPTGDTYPRQRREQRRRATADGSNRRPKSARASGGRPGICPDWKTEGRGSALSADRTAEACPEMAPDGHPRLRPCGCCGQRRADAVH